MTEFNQSDATSTSLHLWRIAQLCQKARLSGRALRKVPLFRCIWSKKYFDQAPFLAFALFCDHKNKKKPTAKEFLVSLEKAVKRQLAEKAEVAKSDNDVKVEVDPAI